MACGKTEEVDTKLLRFPYIRPAILDVPEMATGREKFKKQRAPFLEHDRDDRDVRDVAPARAPEPAAETAKPRKRLITATLSGKSRLWLPKDVVHHLRVEAGDTLIFQLADDGSVVIKPAVVTERPSDSPGLVE